MKKLILIASLFFLFAVIPSISNAQKRVSSGAYRPKTVHVRAYTTKRGTHVRSYYRSRPSRRGHSFIFPVIRRKDFVLNKDIIIYKYLS